jgi:opacity protein-like surface antigen
MMHAKLAQLLSLVAVVCFSTALARAQGIRAFVMGSGSFLQNGRVFTNPVGEQFGSSYASGGKITFGGELSLAKILGFEGSYGIGRNNLRVKDLSSLQTLGYGVRTQRFSANIVAHSPASFLGIRPYATGGLEYDHLGTTSQAQALAFTQGFADQTVKLGASNQVGFNYGAGAEWGFFPTLSLRLDLRDHITGTPTYGLSSRQFDVSGATHDVEISLGLVLHIGK